MVCTTMTLPSTPTVRSVTVPGARLHYEVRGSRGPLLLVIGSPMASADFAPLADALADDIAAILDDLGAESADVFGSSGGAVTGLALVARHPGRVRTLVAHEPPLLELLPDAAEQRAGTEAIIDTFHRVGFGAAWMHFMRNAGFDVSPGDVPVGAADPSEDEVRQAARFFEVDLRPTTQFVPDIEALKSSSSRVIIGIGADSGRLLTYRTSVALAELLGTTPVEFPGDHGGFMGAPTQFADVVREVLLP